MTRRHSPLVRLVFTNVAMSQEGIHANDVYKAQPLGLRAVECCSERRRATRVALWDQLQKCFLA